MNQSVNDEAVCRTAPATPGLLIIKGNTVTVHFPTNALGAFSRD